MRVPKGVVSSFAGGSVDRNLEIVCNVQVDLITIISDIFTYVHQLKSNLNISVICTGEKSQVLLIPLCILPRVIIEGHAIINFS